MNSLVACLCAVVVVLLAALYSVELAPRHEDGLVELSNMEVLMITSCLPVFSYVGDLTNYAQWFPGIENITALDPSPMEPGKKFEETVSLPLYGLYSRLIYVTAYSPPHKVQFLYDDMSEVTVTMDIFQKTKDRCHLEYSAATRKTSLLYHVFVGGPLRIMYSMRGRHGLFAIRSMFNQV